MRDRLSDFRYKGSFVLKSENNHSQSTQGLGKKILIKIGGEGAEDRTVINNLARLVKAWRQEGHLVVIVHGGGKSLTEWGNKCGVPSHFVQGRRVTDDALIDLAQMVFVGQVGTHMMSWLMAHGIPTVALSGVSGGLIKAMKRPPQKRSHVGQDCDQEHDQGFVDYGWVGDIETVNPQIVETLWTGGFVPLVASLGGDGQGNVYNINADTIACCLAEALGVGEVLFLTKLPGVLERVEDSMSTIKHIHLSQRPLDFGGTGQRGRYFISDGMLPKLSAIEGVLHRGVARVEIKSWNDLDCLVNGEAHAGTVLTL